MEVKASPLSAKSVDDGIVLPHRPGNGWGLGGVVDGHGGIAYILRLASVDGTFLDLKESVVAAHSDQSPGHVLKRYAMQTRLPRGVRLYDFMGACECYTDA